MKRACLYRDIQSECPLHSQLNLNEPTKLISTENEEITINCGETAYGKAREFY